MDIDPGVAGFLLRRVEFDNRGLAVEGAKEVSGPFGGLGAHAGVPSWRVVLQTRPVDRSVDCLGWTPLNPGSLPWGRIQSPGCALREGPPWDPDLAWVWPCAAPTPTSHPFRGVSHSAAHTCLWGGWEWDGLLPIQYPGLCPAPGGGADHEIRHSDHHDELARRKCNRRGATAAEAPKGGCGRQGARAFGAGIAWLCDLTCRGALHSSKVRVPWGKTYPAKVGGTSVTRPQHRYTQVTYSIAFNVKNHTRQSWNKFL